MVILAPIYGDFGDGLLLLRSHSIPNSPYFGLCELLCVVIIIITIIIVIIIINFIFITVITIIIIIILLLITIINIHIHRYIHIYIIIFPEHGSNVLVFFNKRWVLGGSILTSQLQEDWGLNPHLCNRAEDDKPEDKTADCFFQKKWIKKVGKT
jgi:hypothetical protein